MAWTPFNFFKYDPSTHDFSKTTFNIKRALNDNWDHVKALITELRSAAVETEATPTAGSTKVLTSGGAYTALAGKQNTPQMAELIMTAAGWSDGKYSLEGEYPADQYDIEVEYAKTCTQEQVNAWNAALLAGSISDNILTAIGEVPTIDIPIYVTATSLTSQAAPQAQMLRLGAADTGYYVEIDGKDQNVQNMVSSDEELNKENYSLEIL